MSLLVKIVLFDYLLVKQELFELYARGQLQ